jgi:8-oxo-dGTP pyrophosphatase MutT (NUDIX family)
MAGMGAGLTRLAEDAGLTVRVAAVCYRVRDLELEFLLVNTTSGKWTFPKGRLEPRMTGSETAALEAWEEAGAKGSIEEDFFSSYIDYKRSLGNDVRTRELVVAAYLMEVHSTVKPQESGRNPRWFSAKEAKKQLAGGRPSKYSVQIAAIVDMAVERLAAKHARILASRRPDVRPRIAPSRQLS